MSARTLVYLVVLLALSGVASAQEPAGGNGGWHTLRVPGGTASLLTVAGLDPARPRASAVLDVIRVIHEVGEGIDAAADARRAAVVSYLETLSAFERARAALPAGISATLAEDKRTRKKLEDFADALGTSLERTGAGYALLTADVARAEQRRTALRAAGLDVSDLVTAFNRGDEVTPTLPADELPLPLPAQMWAPRNSEATTRSSRGLFMQTPDRLAGTLVAAILGDRRASLLYYGLCAMDQETRAFFAATPALPAAIYASARVGTVVLYGRSLRVRQGLVDVPGGASAKGVWERVSGARVSEPEQFVLNVLGRDGGRLALLYDAIAQMDEDRRAFSLGAWLTDLARRLDQPLALYGASAAALAGWDPEARPFARALYDPAHLLLLTPAGAGGQPASPASPRLWRRAFASTDIPEDPVAELTRADDDGPFDAASIVETVCVTNGTVRRDRAEAWLFGHRVFAGAADAAMPDVLVALRGHQRFRMLADTLERMNVEDPAGYAAAMRRAQRITEIGDRNRAAVSLALFQGALVLVERARLARVVDPGTAGRLVRTLSETTLSDNGDWDGAVAEWIDTTYVPAVAPQGADEPVESRVLKAFSGRGPLTADGRPRLVSIEDVQYHIDPSVPVLARLRGVREKQGGWSLDEVLAFARGVRALAGASDLAQATERISSLTASAAALERLRAGPAAPDAALAETLDEVAEAIEDLGRIRTPGDVKKAKPIATKLWAPVDWCLARVLTALAYAPSLGEADGSELLAGDPSPSHDFGLMEPNGSVRASNPWRLPAESHEGTGRWHMTGALLAMDVGLSRQALRRISTDTLPSPPVIKGNQRLALAEAVVLANVFEYRAEHLAEVVGMLRRGRARVASLGSTPGSLVEISRAATLDPLRQELIGWTLAHQPAQVPAFFSAGDLVRIGHATADADAALAAFGTSGWSQEGCLCLKYPQVHAWPSLAGRQGKGLLAATLPDLTLLVAEAIEEHQLPAELTLSVLAAAAQDVIDGLRPAHDDDWMGLAGQIQQMVPVRVDDYVAAVMTGGVLVPLPDRAR